MNKAVVALFLIPLVLATMLTTANNNSNVSVTINISGKGILLIYMNGKQYTAINQTTTITVPSGAKITFVSNTPFTVPGDSIPMILYNITANTNTTVYINFVNIPHESKLHDIAVIVVAVGGLAGLVYLSKRKKNQQ